MSCLLYPYKNRSANTTNLVILGGYVLEYFLGGHSEFMDSALVAWQPHRDDKNPTHDGQCVQLNVCFSFSIFFKK